LAAWKKKEGDKISPGDVIAEVETDKATMDWEATEEGYVAKLLIAPGTKDVAVGKVCKFNFHPMLILWLIISMQIVLITVENAADVGKFANFSVSDQPSAAPKAEAPAKETAKAEPKQAAPPTPEPKAAPAPSAPQQDTSGNSPFLPCALDDFMIKLLINLCAGRVSASPFAKKVATEMGVNVANIPGTGPNNRVIAADVAEYGNGYPYPPHLFFCFLFTPRLSCPSHWRSGATRSSFCR